MELMQQLRAGDSVDNIVSLVNSGIVDVNFREASMNCYGMKFCHKTPLHLVADGTGSYNSEQRKRLLQLFIEHGADVNACDTLCGTPLFAFLTNNSFFDADCIEYLLNNNADVNIGTTLFTNASHICPIERDDYSSKTKAVFEMILEKTLDLNCRHWINVDTPLISAFKRSGHPDCILALLKAGADAKLADCDGNNILHHCAMLFKDIISPDRLALIKTAIDDFGADVNAVNDGVEQYLYSPIEYEEEEEEEDEEEEEEGENKKGLTPFMLSVKNHCDPRLVLLLLPKGTDAFDTKDKLALLWVTFLRGICFTGNFAIPVMEFLFDCGCAFGPYCREEMSYFIERCDDEFVIEVLFMNGASVNFPEFSQIPPTLCVNSRKTGHIMGKYWAFYAENDLKSCGLSSTDVEKTSGEDSPNDELLSQKDGGTSDVERELNELNSEYVKEDLTLYQLCKENDRRKLGSYFSGCRIDLEECKKKFPNFYRMIEYKMEVAEKWHGILASVESLPVWRSRTSDGKEVQLVPECIHRIMNFLNNYELMALSTDAELTVYCTLRCFSSFRK